MLFVLDVGNTNTVLGVFARVEETGSDGDISTPRYQRLVAKVDKGMTAAYEVMVGIPAVRNLVREGKTRQLRNVVTTHRADGMQTLELSLTTLMQEGVIDYQTAVDASLYPQDISKPRSRPAAVGTAG